MNTVWTESNTRQPMAAASGRYVKTLPPMDGHCKPKLLRDDYTAVSLAVIGYVMLHTTALSLGDDEVAALAHEHLQNHAKSVMTLHNIIPGAVIRFLQSEGHPASAAVLPIIADHVESVWHDNVGVPDVDQG